MGLINKFKKALQKIRAHSDTVIEIASFVGTLATLANPRAIPNEMRVKLDHYTDHVNQVRESFGMAKIPNVPVHDNDVPGHVKQLLNSLEELGDAFDATAAAAMTAGLATWDKNGSYDIGDYDKTLMDLQLSNNATLAAFTDVETVADSLPVSDRKEEMTKVAEQVDPSHYNEYSQVLSHLDEYQRVLRKNLLSRPITGVSSGDANPWNYTARNGRMQDKADLSPMVSDVGVPSDMTVVCESGSVTVADDTLASTVNTEPYLSSTKSTYTPAVVDAFADADAVWKCETLDGDGEQITDLPKDSIYDWSTHVEAELKTDWSSVSTSEEITAMIGVTDTNGAEPTVVYQLTTKKPTGGDSSTTKKIIRVPPLSGNIFIRLFSDDGVVIGANGVKVVIHPGDLIGELRAGVDIPADKISYAESGAPFSRYHTIREEDTFADRTSFRTAHLDPNASLPSIWAKHPDVGTLSEAIKFLKHMNETFPTLQSSLDDALGVTFDTLEPVSQWMYSDTAFGSLSVSKKHELMHNLNKRLEFVRDNVAISNSVRDTVQDFFA
jgi:hypothetical protein